LDISLPESESDRSHEGKGRRARSRSLPQRSNHAYSGNDQWSQSVVTMGCSIANILSIPKLAQMQKKLVDWDLKDPKGKSLPLVRKIRDDIKKDC